MNIQLKATTEHGIRILKYLRANEGKPVSKEIAEDLDMGTSYLMRIMALLKAAGFIDTVKGRKGGFALAKKPSEITLYEIIISMEEESMRDMMKAEKEAEAQLTGNLGKIMEDLEGIAKDFLSRITLEDL